ncbi:MAG TPA: Fe-Mn family superoxide dismutase [Candidatus Margulisiibacteriota bacterium]|nr:Fe-Mn family superoxide dismutase [Candidatus Margulisiibacteriota bacterium]
MVYEVNTALRPSGLLGFSEEQIAQHWRLYEGYVAQVNTLRNDLQALRKEGRGNTPLYADRRRRLGYEYNGMVLHEYYFGNLKAKEAEPSGSSPLKKAITGSFGTFDGFKDDFVQAGSTRSVGWAILYLDPATGILNNHFIELHEDGSVAAFMPLLVMDVWEHAYMVDYGASGRTSYIHSFFANVNWPVVEKRFADATAGKIPRRTSSVPDAEAPR